jgi:hypothetical protein
MARAIVDDILQPLVETRTHFAAQGAPALQTLFQIFRMCVSARFSHVLRGVPPRNSTQSARALDTALIRAVKSVLDIRASLSPDETARVDAILALPIRHGGFGIISNADIASAAYIGSWALCGHSVASILPDIQQGANHAGLADLNAVLAANPLATERLAVLLQGPNIVAMLLERPLPKAQKELSEESHKIKKLALVNLLTNRQKTIFTSQSGRFAGAWLCAMPKGGAQQTLNDKEFTISAHVRLMIPFVQSAAPVTQCAACNQPVPGMLTDHMLVCTRHQSRQTKRHHAFKKVLSAFITAAGISNAPEQPLTEHQFARNPNFQGPVNLICDIMTYRNGITQQVLDVMVHVPETRATLQPLASGKGATIGEKLKYRKYNNQLTFPVGSFIPFVVETYGTWGARAYAFFVKTCRLAHGDPRSQAYANFVSKWSQALSCSLQQGNAEVINAQYTQFGAVANAPPIT